MKITQTSTTRPDITYQAHMERLLNVFGQTLFWFLLLSPCIVVSSRNLHAMTNTTTDASDVPVRWRDEASFRLRKDGLRELRIAFRGALVLETTRGVSEVSSRGASYRASDRASRRASRRHFHQASEVPSHRASQQGSHRAPEFSSQAAVHDASHRVSHQASEASSHRASQVPTSQYSLRLLQATDGRRLVQAVTEEEIIKDCRVSSDHEDVLDFIDQFIRGTPRRPRTGNVLQAYNNATSIASTSLPRLRHQRRNKNPLWRGVVMPLSRPVLLGRLSRYLRVSRLARECRRFQSRVRHELRASKRVASSASMDRRADNNTRVQRHAESNSIMDRRDERNMRINTRTERDTVMERITESELKIRRSNMKAERAAASSSHSRPKRDLMTGWFIFPGTKWCGAGDIAEHENDLGYDEGLDSCCRDHDLCPHIIPRLSWRYSLFNFHLHTLSLCRCDRLFRRCLKRSKSPAAHMVGKIYFNVMGSQCFKFKKERTCKRRNWWGKCKRYGFTKVAYPQKQRSFSLEADRKRRRERRKRRRKERRRERMKNSTDDAGMLEVVEGRREMKKNSTNVTEGSGAFESMTGRKTHSTNDTDKSDVVDGMGQIKKHSTYTNMDGFVERREDLRAPTDDGYSNNFAESKITRKFDPSLAINTGNSESVERMVERGNNSTVNGSSRVFVEDLSDRKTESKAAGRKSGFVEERRDGKKEPRVDENRGQVIEGRRDRKREPTVKEGKGEFLSPYSFSPFSIDGQIRKSEPKEKK